MTARSAIYEIGVNAAGPVNGRLRRDRYLHLPVCPAALKALASLSGVIINGEVQHVVTGVGECRGSRGFAGEWNSGSAAGQLFHSRTCIGKSDCGWSTKPGPTESDG